MYQAIRFSGHERTTDGKPVIARVSPEEFETPEEAAAYAAAQTILETRKYGTESGPDRRRGWTISPFASVDPDPARVEYYVNQG